MRRTNDHVRENIDVPVALANNPNTPGDILDELAGHPSVSVRRAVAENSKTPPDILRKLFLRDKEDQAKVELNDKEQFF